MSDLKAAIDSLYTGLLLRDFGAKVAPGVIVLFAVRVGTTDFKSASEDIKAANLGLWLVAIAVAWFTGLAVQGLGEITGKAPWLPWLREKTWLRWLRFPVRYFPDDKKSSDWFALVKRFDAKATPIEQQRFERFVVIREATGNGCVALALAMAVMALTKHASLAVWIAGGSALLGLGVLHHANVERIWKYAETVAPETNG